MKTAITAAVEFRGGKNDLVTVPLGPLKPTSDTYSVLAVQERPDDLIACDFMKVLPDGSMAMPGEVFEALNTIYPENSVNN